MGFKMKGFNPGKGTKMGASFKRNHVDISKVTSFDEQLDRPLYQRDYMNLEGRKDLPGSYYQSPASIATYGDKNI